MSEKVKNKVALITGANRGIGKALLEGLLAAGASKVYAGVRDLSKADSLIAEYGSKVVPIKIDLEDVDSIKSAATDAQDVGIVINNAGVLTMHTPLDENAIEAFQQEMNINVYGLMHMAQAFAPILKANGGGIFAQLNSVASMKNFAGFSTYCASKAAAYSITLSIREVLEEQGTRVISIHPGPIATDMGDSAGFGEIAEPATVVSNAFIEALENDDVHVFPDMMAKQVGEAYGSFAENVVLMPVSFD
jgi:NAD(P)-dependent dehydrogenase (short-subunit alcohol dehydrogenase family)